MVTGSYMAIKLRFIRENTLVSWLIRLFTGGQWSHVEFVTPLGYLAARPPGVMMYPFDYCHPSAETFGTVNCTPEVAEKVIEFVYAQVGKPYNFLAILGDATNEDITEKDAYDCSQLVATAFAQANWPLLKGVKLFRINPQQIYDSPLVIKEKQL